MHEVTLHAPAGMRRRVNLVGRALARLAVLEIPVRRRSVTELCAGAGIGFAGFERPTPVLDLRPLPRHVAEVWWALEVALTLWPWARRRRCLRRGLVLGRQISYLAPVLVLETLRTTPLEIHAVLMARGHRLDLGTLETTARSRSRLAR